MSTSLKVASFHIRATMEQSIRWKRSAESEGFSSVGTWAACALDAHLRVRARAGQPVPLAWRRGRFLVRLESGEERTVRGHVSEPFGVYVGTAAGPYERGRKHAIYALTYVPSRRVLATLSTFRECKALASDLARTWVRGDGSDPATST